MLPPQLFVVHPGQLCMRPRGLLPCTAVAARAAPEYGSHGAALASRLLRLVCENTADAPFPCMSWFQGSFEHRRCTITLRDLVAELIVHALHGTACANLCRRKDDPRCGQIRVLLPEPGLEPLPRALSWLLACQHPGLHMQTSLCFGADECRLVATMPGPSPEPSPQRPGTCCGGC